LDCVALVKTQDFKSNVFIAALKKKHFSEKTSSHNNEMDWGAGVAEVNILGLS